MPCEFFNALNKGLKTLSYCYDMALIQAIERRAIERQAIERRAIERQVIERQTA